MRKLFSQNASTLLPSSIAAPIGSISLMHYRTVSDDVIDEMIRNNILGDGVSPQSRFIKPGKPNELGGKLLTFNNPEKIESLETLNPEDSNFVPSAILSCGLGSAGSREQLHESYRAISQILQTSKIAVYSSLTDAERREERFRNGLPYYYNESHIIEEESENFFDQTLKNRFFEDENLRDPRSLSNLVLFGFSIGHRENVSHINYLQKKITEALAEENKDPELLQSYLNKIALVNIGSPVNWRGTVRDLPKEMLDGLAQGGTTPQDIEKYCEEKNLTATNDANFPKINIVGIRSIYDMGTSKPKSDFNNFHCDKHLFSRSATHRFVRPDDNRLEYMYVLDCSMPWYFSRGAHADQVKNNTLDHSLEGYARIIDDTPDALLPITSLMTSPSFDLSRQSRTRMHFDPSRKPSEKDWKTLKREWGEEMSIRDVKKSTHEGHKTNSGRDR